MSTERCFISIFFHSVVVKNATFLPVRTFRCTLTSIPQTQALLNKARLPLGLLLHPFRDLQVSVNYASSLILALL